MVVQFVSRQIIFDKNQVLARHVFDWQNSCYDPTDYLVEPGESVWLDLDDKEATKLNDQQSKQYNSEQVAYFKSLRDEFVRAPDVQKSVRTVIAETKYESVSKFHQNIGKLSHQLFKLLDWSEVLLISDSTRPYLAQTNDYPPVTNAEKTLFKLGFDRKLTDGIIVSMPVVDSLFSSFFRIVRYNASSPYIFFSSPKSSIIGTLCKYGNFHFELYDQTEEEKLMSAIDESEFSLIENGICEENFSPDTSIEGRQLDIS